MVSFGKRHGSYFQYKPKVINVFSKESYFSRKSEPCPPPPTDLSIRLPILGSNADILIDFLNTIFRGEVVIIELSLKSFKQGRTQEERKAVFDLYCITNKDERIIIEITTKDFCSLFD